MGRQLDETTLDAAAREYAANFFWPTRYSKVAPKVAVAGRDWTLNCLYNAHFKDEHDAIVGEIRRGMAGARLEDFDRAAKAKFKPRSDRTFEKLLRDRLAIDHRGEHVAGAIGTVRVGGRFVGFHQIEVETLDSIRFRKRLKLAGVDPGPRETHFKRVPLIWPIYAGEGAERAAGRFADPLPTGTPGLPIGALNTRIANVAAIAAVDAVVDLLDGGTGAAVAKGYTASQPADVDTAVSGQTLLFTLVYSDPAFGSGADAGPGGIATASAITPDSSADATGTLAWVRCSSSNDGATALDDLIDGEAGLSSADWILNTLAIVSGATVNGNSHTVTMPES